MNTTEKDIELFDGYMDGTLSDTERTQFEERLRNDEAYRKAYELHSEVVLGIQRKELKAMLQELEQELSEIMKVAASSGFSVPRRTMTLFFVIDTSGSMAGSKIGAVNDAVVNVLPMLDEISATNPDAEIKVAVLEFSTGCNWLYSNPKLANEFVWQDVQASGLTSLGAACEELENKLSRSKGFMQSASGSFAPAIILLSDGSPTDNFEASLAKLKANNWFKSAIKVAIAIGDDADKDVLTKFTGTNEAVFTVHNIDALKQIIRLVAVTMSKIGSKSSTEGDATKQEQVISEVQQAVDNIDGAEAATQVDNSSYIDDWG